MDLDALVKANRSVLQPAARAVASARAFDMSLPCEVLKEDGNVTTNLAGLRGYLPCSTALASEPIERFLTLRDAVGFDAAFEAMSADDEVGEEFVEVWDRCQADLDGGVVCTLNDIVAMVEQAKQGWEATPRKLLVVARAGNEVASGTVAVDWVLAG